MNQNHLSRCQPSSREPRTQPTCLQFSRAGPPGAKSQWGTGARPQWGPGVRSQWGPGVRSQWGLGTRNEWGPWFHTTVALGDIPLWPLVIFHYGPW